VGQRFPSRCLAGVGVAFYLAASLARRHTGTGRPAAALLDLVSLGTVADLVPLDANNRILVERGLARIRAGDCRPGVTALLAAGGRAPAATTSADLAFAAGPRLNAAGRLEDMSIGIECLLTDDPARACELAGALSRINEERKSIEARMQEEALAAVAGLEPDIDALPPVLCLHRPGWHPGVVGLVAARLRERFHRPAVAFASDGEGRLKGSARSIAGLHMRDVLAAVDVRHPGLIERYGGHAMAAGVSLAADALAAFDAALRDEVAARIDAADLAGEIWSDGELADGELDLATAELLMSAGPWGQGFPEPLFDGRFDLLDSDVVGGLHLRLRLRPAGGSSIVQGIAFRQADSFVGPRPELVHIAYRLGVNDYAGMRRAQLVVDYLEPA
jgi:single-stranded-DNA-specific exonuclease